jgi:hypothetical protein
MRPPILLSWSEAEIELKQSGWPKADESISG